MKTEPRNIWDRNAHRYDFWEWGGARRHAPHKRGLFRQMQGRVLFVAAGTGADFCQFPDGLEIVAIDLSAKMLAHATKRLVNYQGRLALTQSDVQMLPFPDSTFDTVATSCTFCSVPSPPRGLAELHRVLRANGKLLMFEHVRSRNWLVGWIQDFMTFFVRSYGPKMNRRTIETVKRAGFKIEQVRRTYLDVFLAIEAKKQTASPVSPDSGSPAEDSCSQQVVERATQEARRPL